MIIQTSICDFLIEENEGKWGSVFIYSEVLEEIQRLFGSSEVELTTRDEWKYRVSICKQDLANALILMVKEVNYPSFSQVRLHPA
ncbi:hypothetical protein GCM10009119_40460 [Algoriphagus jejuensis]|uniref:Uncharacterized protein n=1 Tax=Algoriphagus jejuensis TaxID=419934 RepID=A0ABP3YLE5_9BACT